MRKPRHPGFRSVRRSSSSRFRSHRPRLRAPRVYRWAVVFAFGAAVHFTLDLPVVAPCPANAATAAVRAETSVTPALPLLGIDLAPWDALRRLDGLGLDLVELRPGLEALALGWPGTEDALRGAGLDYTVRDPDVGATLAARARAELADEPAEEILPGVPAPGQGSLGGFWTYDEVVALLTTLAARDTAGILTEVQVIGRSVEGRPIPALGVTAERGADGDRPAVLLTALTHGREPQGMQGVLALLLHLVEGYGTDPEVTALVEEREIWFVPVVNPDAYVANERAFREEGRFGFRRKNLRDADGDGVSGARDGVDLNRNFGYRFGHDDYGSSPDPASPVYRGAEAFSEPETRALRDLVRAKRFRTAANFHAFHEAVLYPWGSQDRDTPDAEVFLRIADEVSRATGYPYGRGDELLHSINGDADDWLYGDRSGRPRCFSMTLEVGGPGDGFWPPPSRIVPLAERTLGAGLVIARAAGPWLVPGPVELATEHRHLEPGRTAVAEIPLRHRGVTGTARAPRVEVRSLHPDLAVRAGVVAYPDLDPGDSSRGRGTERFEFRARPDAVPGRSLPVLVTVDGEGGASSDTAWVRIGPPRVQFAADASRDFEGWETTGGWGVERVDGRTVFSDSPGSLYPAFADSRLTLRRGIDLTGAAEARLVYETRWEVERGFDVARVEASRDGGLTWVPLAGSRTHPGRDPSHRPGARQTPGEPGLDGTCRVWVEESVDLASYAGTPDLRLRFRLLADGARGADGWLVDGIRVLAYGPPATGATASATEAPHPPGH